MKPQKLSLCLFPLIILAVSSEAKAQLTWDNRGANNNWSSADANWLPGSVVWADGQDAVFDVSPEIVTPTTTNIVDDITFNGSWTIANGAAASINLTTDGNSDITVGSGFTTTISEVLSGTNSLSKLGAGNLTLTSANTYSGGTILSNGVLSVSAANQLGTGGISLNGGTLQSTASANFDTNTITVGASGGTINQLQTGSTFRFQAANRLLGSGTLTITGNPALDRTQSLAYSGVVVASFSNTYNGNVILQNGGLLEYGNAAAMASAATITVNNNGEFSNSNVTVNQAITVNSGGSLGFQNGNLGVYSGPITLNGSTTIVMRDWYAVTVRNGAITSTMTGGGAINVMGGGALTLKGFDAKASTSDITVNRSGLLIDSSAGVAAAAVTRGDDLTLNASNLTVTGVASQATSDVFSGALNIGAGKSSITLTPNAATNAQLTFAAIGTRAAGSIVNINGTFGATPAANGANLYFTTAPSGANFVGGSAATSIIPWLQNSGGALFGYDATRGVTPVSLTSVDLNSAAATDNVNDGNGSTLTANKTVNSLTGTGNFAMGGNTLTVTSGVISNLVNVTIGSDTATPGTLDFGTAEAVLSSRQARVLQINSVITGSGGLTHIGYRTNSGNAGRLVLNGANTFTGQTNLYGDGAVSGVYLTNSLALQNSTLNYGAANGAALTFGPPTPGTTAPTSYTFGGLMGDAGINLNNNNTTAAAVALTVGGNNESTTYSGVLSSTVAGGSLTKTGSGALTLTNSSTYSGPTNVNSGSLVINGNISTSSLTTVANTATLKGGGSVGALIALSGGTVSPGDGFGILNAGNTNLQAASSLGIDIGGAAVGTGYDQLNVTGSATLAGLLNISLSYAPANGALFYILNNDGSDPVSGTFTGLANNSIFNVGGQDFQISYAGDNATQSFTGGNDVVLMAVPEPASIILGSLGVLVLLRRRRLQ